MSDENNVKPTLTRKPLTLSRSLESGEVKQTFSHGRTKTVVVETKRRPGAPVGGHQRPAGFDVARPRSDAPAPQAPGVAAQHLQIPRPLSRPLALPPYCQQQLNKIFACTQFSKQVVRSR